MNTLINTRTQSDNSSKARLRSALQRSAAARTADVDRPQGEQSRFLQGVLEAMMDGVLVVTEQGALVYANRYARQYLQLIQDFNQSNSVPQQILQSCKALIESRALFPHQFFALEDEISLNQTCSIRIRVRWIELDEAHQTCLLVTLEDRNCSAQNAAIAEAKKYGLTEREAEVWLLRRANLTYKAIAAQLHIAVDTVKKHLKNIHAKRQAVLWQEE